MGHPIVRVCCEFEGKGGKDLLIIVPNPPKRELLLHVFRSHFYKRYGERYLNGEKDYRKVVTQYLIRNTRERSLGPECVSIREQQEDELGYTKESMLTMDGLGLGLRSNDKNIIVHRTFVCFDQLFKEQFEKVWPNYLNFVCGLAIDDFPNYAAQIMDIYNKGITKMQQIASDYTISDEDKCHNTYDVYKETCQKLKQYIV